MLSSSCHNASIQLTELCRNQISSTSSLYYETSSQKSPRLLHEALVNDLLRSSHRPHQRLLRCLHCHKSSPQDLRAPYNRPPLRMGIHHLHLRNPISNHLKMAPLHCPLFHQVYPDRQASTAPECSLLYTHQTTACRDTIVHHLCLPPSRLNSTKALHNRILQLGILLFSRPTMDNLRQVQIKSVLHPIPCHQQTLDVSPAFLRVRATIRVPQRQYNSINGSSIRPKLRLLHRPTNRLHHPISWMNL